MMDRSLNGQDKVCPSSTSCSAESFEKLVSTDIFPYYENPNEESSGKCLYTRIILKLQINYSCVWEQTHEIYLAILRIL